MGFLLGNNRESSLTEDILILLVYGLANYWRDKGQQNAREQFILMQKLNQKGVKVNETSLGIDRTSNLATSKECNSETVKPSQPN